MPIPVAGVILGAVGVWLTANLGKFILAALAAIGVSYVTYTGMDIAIDTVYNLIKSRFSGLSVDILGLLGRLGVDEFISIILSGYTAGITMRVAMGIGRFTFQRPGA
jgi:hypothetical protein